jgi:hypothetical protein
MQTASLRQRLARSIGRTLPLAAITLAMPLAIGCATPASMKAGKAEGADGRVSPTRGVAVLFEERIPSRSIFRRYELHPDGSLKVGGGAAARDRRTEWTGTPNDDELTAILDAIDASGIAVGPPACTPALVEGEESIFVRIEYAAPSGTLVHELGGRCPALEPLREAFEKASLVRFERQLDRLPEAGAQPSRIIR